MVAKAITKLSRKAEGLDGMGADILKKSWAGWVECTAPCRGQKMSEATLSTLSLAKIRCSVPGTRKYTPPFYYETRIIFRNLRHARSADVSQAFGRTYEKCHEIQRDQFLLPYYLWHANLSFDTEDATKSSPLSPPLFPGEVFTGLFSARPRFEQGSFLAQVAFAENSLTEARHGHVSSPWLEISPWEGGDDEGQAVRRLSSKDLWSVQVCDMEPFWEKEVISCVRAKFGPIRGEQGAM
ncbi:hypothetical protein AK812_SmicGene34935 [Symbiodinium microadriaticum]|uniref:Uncharacterized protein n=1 Tax=Symbiodinium microadriaticum TaxID=2951 RepID=A0A1Q9CMS7_SYMMI|nr:hypothetical protein AK812_SmicGene34935 [Symbiodinium microadriaticum]